MTNNAWAHLPNAAHIDRVLAHLSANPEKWAAVWGAARGAGRDAAWDAARDAVRGAAWDAVRDAVRAAAWDTARDASRYAAWDACVALVAWDEVGDLLDQSPEVLKFLAEEGVHAAVLLYPAVLAMRDE